MENMQEIWTEIIYDNNGEKVNYNGIYQISSLGRIKAIRNGKEKILKTRFNNWGYELVNLSKDGVSRTFTVHRLMAWHFIENDDREHKTQVNHIDENTKNNRVDNLEFVTPKQNSNHGTRNERIAKSNTGRKQNQGSLVAKLVEHDDGTLELLEVKKTSEYVKDGFSSQGINKCCNGKRKTHNGFVFRYYICATEK